MTDRAGWRKLACTVFAATVVFFLGMWVGSQDPRIRPSQSRDVIDQSGVTKSPKEGAVLDDPRPDAAPTVSCPGRVPDPNTSIPNVPTATVINWLRGDVIRFNYWKARGARCLENAFQQGDTHTPETPEALATRRLAQILASELPASLPKDMPEVFKELLFASFKEIDWSMIAEDMLTP